MTDITGDFNICLKQKGAEPVLPKQYDLQSINAFLQEAYSIVCMLWRPQWCLANICSSMRA